ncbi:malto-oligosyltrehalose trehalohydrolase [Chitinasiproducens palmae]|uniref:Malto-oligosyltrehalose trehalohydrolase n=1 Tax=Chitinasiproducens palmae TaxID=1770053 RepID=A0A1H2PM60_9BURK|nr:malto-oligosyltrehalose trehalohydrolase [Chitinasiproducens palmae]SDV47656.1 maltooligosyl trehalose hydrolase [Chitinasiproducens palmae]
MSVQPLSRQRRHFARTLPFGAEIVQRGAHPRTRFRFWAPSAQTVAVALENGPKLPMAAAGDGWFEAEADCGAGTRYRYQVDDSLNVPDPASRFQPDDLDGPSMVVDPHGYEWQQPTWAGRPWRETVLYELHVGACGGYTGVQARLPELTELGVTAIELMPINDFKGRHNWGYDGALPFAPDSAYGTPDELKALIDAAHGLGLMVFLDVVYNHFGPTGNYLPTYAKSFFKEGVDTPWGAAIDFDRQQVRDFFFDNALYWLNEYRFDGLRFDAVHAINNDGWLRELAQRVRGGVERGRHVHLVLENEGNTASLLGDDRFDAQWSDDSHNTLHVLLTGETESYYEAFAQDPARKLARLLAEGFVYQGEASPIHDGETRGEPSAHLPPTAFVLFLQNHDQVGNRAFGERLTRLCAPDALRAATLLMLLSPQIPMLFMGEEYGSEDPFLFFTDYEGELADAVREGRRREFAKFAAFNDPERRERIPDPNDHRTFAASRAMPADANGAGETNATLDAWRRFYRRGLALRHAQIVPRLEDARATGARALSDKAVFAQWRMNDATTLSIALNLGDDALSQGDGLPGEVPPNTCLVWLGDALLASSAELGRDDAETME